MARLQASPDPSLAAAGAAAAPLEPSRAGRSRWKRRLKLFLVLAPLAAIALATAYIFLALHFSYSSGERAGYVQKFSKKGWICKTWEGELAMANMPGVMPELFAFSLHDDQVAAEINKHLGSRVTLHYEQHLGLPSCFGETSYWVTSVRPVTP